MSALGGFVKVCSGDIPASDIKINWAGHRKDFLYGLEDVSECAVVLVEFESNVSGCTLSKRAVEVCAALSLSGSPGELLAVSKDASGKGRTIVTAKTN